MGLSVVFVSGPRRAGKSSVIRAMLDCVWKIEPHYLRLVERGGDKAAPKMPPTPPPGCGVATARTVEYEPDRAFEVVPEVLSSIHREDRFGAVVIEADSDPILRCAYDYNHRVFVMPAPPSIESVFRPREEAALQLRRLLEDTAAFASSMFGVLGLPDIEDEGPRMLRPQMTGLELSTFINSPLGEELATRVALQPAYHGLVESDVVLINRIGGNGELHTDCVHRIEQLLARLGRVSKRRGALFVCDPFDLGDKISKQFYKAVRPMCTGGK